MEEWMCGQYKSETIRREVQRSEKTEEAWDSMGEEELSHLSEEGIECAFDWDWQLRPAAAGIWFAELVNWYKAEQATNTK